MCPDFGIYVYAQQQPDEKAGYLCHLLALQPGVSYYWTSQGISFLICKMG